LIATWILRLYIRPLDELLTKVDFTVEFGSNKILPMPGGYLFPALLIGMLTRVFRVHARISDWLAIRECFDTDVIIRELATRLKIDISTMTNEQLIRYRHSIMRKAFYPYVNASDPAIDSQLVQQALDAWSWFWVGVEATFVFVLTGFGLIAGGMYNVGAQTLCVTLLLAVFALPMMRRQCQRYAIAQVRAIIDDSVRATAVKAAFAELTSREVGVRQAA
jgi:hypothetical protein